VPRSAAAAPRRDDAHDLDADHPDGPVGGESYDGGMQLGGITRKGILAAIAECDQLGRDAFLAKYGYKPATSYVLEYRGSLYDPKAIAGVAHLYDFGRALKPAEFSSGIGSGQAVAWLRREGFAVMTFEQELLRRIGSVRPARRGDGQARHRPLLLLWAIGQAAAGASRVQSWSIVRSALAPLLTKYAEVQDGADGARYPFWVLRRDGLWEVTRSDELTMTSQGRRPTLESLNAIYPDAGLLEKDYEILRAKPEVAAEAVAGLILRYFPSLPTGLLEDLGLTQVLGSRWADALRPLVGEQFKNRDAIWHVYGGQKMAGIGCLGDGILSAFSDDKGPYADGRLPDTGWIGYVGDGLSGDQQLTAGNQLMADHQAARQPLRYWHKPFQMEFTFETWAVVVQRRMRWGQGEDGQWRREFVWVLAPVPSPQQSSWPTDVMDALDADTGELYDETLDYRPEDIDLAATPPSGESSEDAYRRLTEAATKRAAQRSTSKKRSVIDKYMRCQSARAAVIRRSEGNCESPECEGHPKELTSAGEPILQVDHVQDLAKGGADLPWNMIALCPNCHAVKTYGANRDRLGRVLQKTAKQLHESAINSSTPRL
jgi:5-methylcytosine-specific restriction protein A